MSCVTVDEPVRVGCGVEDGVDGCGEGVQGRRLEAEAASEVRWDGAHGVDLAEPFGVGLCFTTCRARVVSWRKGLIKVGSVAHLCEGDLEHHT